MCIYIAVLTTLVIIIDFLLCFVLFGFFFLTGQASVKVNKE